jgi:hypothetical protein
MPDKDLTSPATGQRTGDESPPHPGTRDTAASNQERVTENASASRSDHLERECTRCGETKPLTEFYRHQTGRLGRGSQCKRCVIKQNCPPRKGRSKQCGLYFDRTQDRWYVYCQDGTQRTYARCLMEGQLGRLLSPDLHVHHINGDHRDDRIENLEVLTRAEHKALHHKLSPRVPPSEYAEMLARWAQGWTHAQLAATYAISVRSVKRRLARARELANG